MGYSAVEHVVRERPVASLLRLGLLLIPLSACATGATATPPAGVAAPAGAAAAAAEASAPPKEIHWVRSSAEYPALTRQSYRFAEERVRAASAGKARGSWAVILDADETVVDNSEYQRRLAARGDVYATATWQAWVREQRAGAVPGAKEFLTAVAALGGRIAIVTNRDDVVCPETRANLQALAIPFDVVLCRVQGQSDKNPRFAAVANGTAAPGQLPPLEVLLWVGDNIQDFPSLSQEVRQQPAAFEPFGRTYIMIPNPMYGSWETNPPS